MSLVPGGGYSTSSSEIVRRLASLIPSGWFSSDRAPFRDALFGASADVLAVATNLIAYAYDQSRIASASGWFLDLLAWDFFGARFQRRRGESDDRFRPRVLKEILRPRATRAAITQVLVDLTGNAPKLVELWQPGDCGAYDVGTLAYAGEPSGTGSLGGYDGPLAGYEAGAAAYVTPSPSIAGAVGAGCWGSYDYRNQIFVTAYRTPGMVAAGSGFYDTGSLAYGGEGFAGAGYYASNETDAAVSDAEIYAAIASVMPAGVIAWTDIENALPV